MLGTAGSRRIRFRGYMLPAGTTGFPAARLLLLLSICLPGTLPADELDRIEPQPVPESARPPVPETGSTGEKMQEGEDSDRSFGVNLQGVAFLPKPDLVNPYGLLVDEDADVPENQLPISAESLPELQTPVFAERLNAYRDAVLSEKLLNELKQEVSSYYRSIDRPFVSVSIPPQDISSGVVQIVVVEARLGNVTVQGNKWFDERQYLSALRLKADEEIRLDRLNEDIVWINRNPFRNADVFAKAGQEFGRTDITIVTNERLPLRLYAGYDNYGTDISGKDRVLAGFNWGNAFNLGHELNYQFTRSVESGLLSAHSGTYVAPLQWRHILSVSAAYSENDPDLAEPFDSEGWSWSVEPAYTIPLERRGAYSHQVSARIPFKSTDNTLEFSQMPVTDNLTHVIQAELGYAGSWSHERSELGFSLDLVASPGGLTDGNTDERFDVSRAGAEADYGILRGGLSYRRSLPNGWRWSSNFVGQWATDNLLGSEQLSMTGVGAVRGYDNGLIFRDLGLVMRNELVAPAFSLLGLFTDIDGFVSKHNVPRDGLNLHVFLDAAAGDNVDPLPGEQSSDYIASAGVGLRYTFGPLLSVILDYGWQLSDDPTAVSDTSSQLHMSITVGY